MPSEYDALLAAEQPTRHSGSDSEYDALLTAPNPQGEGGPTPSTPAAYLQDKLLSAFDATPRAREIVSNAEYGIAKVARDFVPQSLSSLLGFVTPVIGSFEELKKDAGVVQDLASGKTFEESMRANHPEDFAIVDAEKTPAFSKERFATGLSVAAQALMAAAGVRALRPRPRLTETLFPSEQPAIDNLKSEIPPEEVIQHAEQITKAAQPDGVRTEPPVPPKVEEPAAPQSGEGIPESRQGPQVQEVTPAPATISLDQLRKLKSSEQEVFVPALRQQLQREYEAAIAEGSPDNAHPEHLKSGGANQYIDALKQDIRANGMREPIELGIEGGKVVIQEGNNRAVAAHELDLQRIPIKADEETIKTLSEPRPRTFRGPADVFGSEVTPVAQYLADSGVLSKSQAKKAGKLTGNEDLWNGAGDILSHPTHNKIYKPTGDTPDVAAQNLFDAGLINDSSPDTMWAALSHESQTARTLAREDRAFSKAEKEAHTEWQDQLKNGERDPAIALRSAGGEPGLISRSEDGKGVELSLLDANGEPKVSETHATLDEALKSAHDLGMRLDDATENGQPIFADETAPSAGPGDTAPPQETPGAPPATSAAAPKLRPGEKQGDLLSTQTENLKLVGEQGPDHAARAAAEEKATAAKSEYDALTEAAQSKLFPEDTSSAASHHDWTGATAPSGKGMTLSKTTGQAAAIPNPLASPIVAKALKTIEARKMSPLDASTAERSARLQQSFADAERAQKEIAKVAPNERRQAAISIWMEANGDTATLSQWAAAAKGKAFREAATAAQSLTPEELAIAQKARGAFDVLEKRGNAYDVLSNHRDNYVPHVWDVSKDFTGIGSSKLQDRFKFNKARTFNNFFEGDQAGFQPKTMAIGKLLPAYLHEMNKVIADRQFIQDLQAKGATASDGSPLVIPRGRVTTIDTDSGGKAYLADPNAYKNAKDAAGNPIDQSKYKVIGDQPALNDWRWESKDEAGNPIYMKDDLAVHPELAKRLNATMGQSAIRQWYNEPSTGVAVIPKAIAKALDTAQSVMKREMFSLLAPFHQVQEGTHAIGHTVNPFGGLEDMSRPTPEHIDAMNHGLMLLPDRASSAAYIEGLGGRGGFIAQAGRWLGEKAGGNVIGKAANAIASTIDGYQNYLFHQYIPALKFKTYAHILERNTARYADDIKSGKITEADVKLLSAEQSNAAYGHINYALLDRNPTMHHITQLALLAPDFLEARGRFVGQAAKSLIGEKAGHEQFRAIAVLAATQAATMFTLSKVLGGEWDWKHPFEMTVGNRRYMLRSVPEDLHRLLFQGPDVRREFVSARVNPTLQKVDQLRTGLNYRGEKTGALDTMGELIANYIPITARSLPGVRRLTETSRNSPVSPLEQLAGSLGLKISRYSAITHTHQLAAEWMDKQKIERPAGVYPTSKFTPLRYALEDADLPRAEKEWKKLVGDEGDEKKLAEGFKQSITHPFTGNKSRDQDFANSLKGKDRLLYDRALEVREGILDKFNLIH